MRGVERADNPLVVEVSRPGRVVMSFYLSIISLQGLCKAQRVWVDKLRIFIDDTARMWNHTCSSVGPHSVKLQL